MMRPYKVVSTAGMTREQWLDLRRTGIGGSDAAAIAGLSRYATPMSVWLEKTGRLAHRQAGEAAEWGTILEPIVADYWAKRTGRRVRQRRVMLRSVQHPHMIANVDRWVLGDEEAILEVKTGGAFRAQEWQDGRIPDEYAVQGMHYLAVTGLKRVYYAALLGGQRFVTAHLDRDEEAIAALVKLEGEFWRLVDADTPPAVDGRDETADYLLALYPNGDPSLQVSLPPDFFDQYDSAKAAFDAAEERLNRVKNEARQMLGSAVRGVSGERRVTWSDVAATRFDQHRFQVDHPDLYRLYLTETRTRRLTFS